MSSDALVLLREDHAELKRLFRQFKETGPEAKVAKGRLVDQMIELLTVHTYLENQCLYPQMRQLVPEIEDDILESYEEHHVADVLCTELALMSPEDEHFVAKTTVLIESVRHHIEEEETGWFPKVRDALGRKELQAIGEEMIAMRIKAPTSPAQPGALKKAVRAVVG